MQGQETHQPGIGGESREHCGEPVHWTDDLTRECVDCGQSIALTDGAEWPGSPEETLCWGCMADELANRQGAIARGEARIRELEATIVAFEQSLEAAINRQVDIRSDRDATQIRCEQLETERDRLRVMLARWVADADAGMLDGVDLELMVESEELVGV